MERACGTRKCSEMKFEIINPSDEAYIEGDFKTCVLATLLFGEGKYGLVEVDDNLQQKESGLEMPLFLLGYGLDEWLKKQFGKTLKQLLDETSKEDIGKALLSVHLVRERSSLNDFTSYANSLGKRMLKQESDEVK